MMDLSLDGMRCRTTRRILHHGGYLPRALGGTVRYTTENVGRTLLRVDFDSGESMLVLPDDVHLDGLHSPGRGRA
jgi:hypothetical protein